MSSSFLPGKVVFELRYSPFLLYPLSVYWGQGESPSENGRRDRASPFPKSDRGKTRRNLYSFFFFTFREPDKILWAATKMLLMFADIYALLPLIAGRTVNFSAACVATVYCSLYFSGGASHSEATSTETVD